MFQFKGDMIFSKSWYNRMQIVRFFNPNLKLMPETLIESDDVKLLEKAISDFKAGKTDFNLGLGGTGFRFFCFLVSRYPGEWKVKGESRLLARPQLPLIKTLRQLGVQVKVESDGFLISSKSWVIPSEIVLDAEISTQFMSGLLLSAWDLKSDLIIKIQKPILSYDYLRMTIDLIRRSGMEMFIENHERELLINILPNQKVKTAEMQIEPDVSSAFSLAACAVVNGEATITNWMPNSIQPDMAFLDLFQKMKISFEQNENQIKFCRQNSWNSIDANLANSPDLFPVLATLCALAEGKSRLFGAAQLRDKESDRIAKTCELLSAAGFEVNELTDGLEVIGTGLNAVNKSNKIEFNPEHDHRMAMAAAVLILAGIQIKLTDANVVNKSYPNFWADIGVTVDE